MDGCCSSPDLVLPLDGASTHSSRSQTTADARLQEKYFQQLQTIGADVQAHVFPYSSISAACSTWNSHSNIEPTSVRSVLTNYGGMTVVELTGNYFAVVLLGTGGQDPSRPADLSGCNAADHPESRWHRSKDNPDVDGFAMEISHHVRGKAMGMNIERAENLVLVLPKNVALRLVNAKTRTTVRPRFSTASSSSMANHSFCT